MKSFSQQQRHKQTKAQNRAAFKLWLTGCTDQALSNARPQSIANSYGLDPVDVAADIVRQAAERRSARAG